MKQAFQFRSSIFSILLSILIFAFSNANATSLTVIRDAETEILLTEIATTLFSAADIRHSKPQIVIYKDSNINAFVIDKNHIFISSKLITTYDSPEIIAGVMAHEIGHIKANHLFLTKSKMKDLKKTQLFTLLAGLGVSLLAGTPDPLLASALSASAVAQDQFLSFSRSQETHADTIGINLLHKTKISSVGLETLLSDFNKREKLFFKEEMQYFRTHPMSSERLRLIYSNRNRDNSYFSEDFLLKYKRACHKMRILLKEDNRMPSDPYLKAVYLSSNHKFQDLLNLELDQNDPFSLELIAEAYYGIGDKENAVKYIEQAYSKQKKSVVIAIEYAFFLITADKDLDKAINLLESAIHKEKDSLFIWHYLGIAHEKSGNTSQAMACYAYQHFLSNRIPLATQFLAKVKKEDLDKKFLERVQNLQERIIEHTKAKKQQ